MDDLKEKLIQLLTKIFQFDNEDLDFGIYKILNYKKEEISNFIHQDLVEEISSELNLLSYKEKELLNQDLDRMKKELQEYGISDYESNPKYIDKLNELKKLNVSEALEKDVYNHLYTFFSRYYDKGDFVSKRRYSRQNKYAIPYNGEEILLYWANKDQYYIKTSEFLQKYSFRIPDLKINFRIAQAEEEKGNVKSVEKKFFIVKNEDFFTFNNNELNIYFEYRGLTQKEKKTFSKPNQDKINDHNLKFIIGNLAKESKFGKLIKRDKNDKTILGKHLYRYTSRNTYDYFIHKDLKGFLERELDFYVKNEIFNIDDVTLLDPNNLHRHILEIKVIKAISAKIIEFISQIEEFQKKLWEKKKFVLSTNYCITLDYVDEKYYSKILENEKQIKEWENLFNFDIKKEINKIKSDTLFSKDKNEIEVLRQNPTLLIDTKFFDDNFKINLLMGIDNLDQKISGILINSDNYHALNLLEQKYHKKIKCCYIDPPYNAKSSEILYKNTFKHSSWLSLMEDRLKIAKSFFSDDGILVVAIDENEQERLGLLLDEIFSEYQKTCVTIIHNPSGIQGDNFSYTNEFAYFVFPKNGRFIGFQTRDENLDVRNFRDVTGDDSLRNSGANCFYPIYVKNGEIVGFGDVCEETFHPGEININRNDGIIEVYPIDPQGIERKWRFARQTVESIKDELKANQIKRRDVWDIKRIKNKFNFKTVWMDSKYSANNHGTQLLNNIIEPGSFSFPKSVYNVKDCLDATMQNNNHALVLDYFAGSGTTGHALLKLNKEIKGSRKFILIEMGQYFETVLKPRILRVIFSEEWKDCKPRNKNGHPKQIIKYQKLEQYEDSLENIEFSQKALDNFNDYFISYMLDFETRDSKTFLNIDQMENPFDYKIKVLDDYQLKTVPVDLPETYNYLIGLEVNRIMSYENEYDNNRRYLVYKGKSNNLNLLIIWRDIKNFDPQKDQEFLNENIITEEFDEIHLNGDSLIPEAVLIQENFKRLMNGS